MSGSGVKPKIGQQQPFQVPDSYRSGPPGHGAASTRTHTLKETLYANQSQPTPASYQVKKPQKIGRVKLWIRRNPNKFQALAITTGLGLFFSKPIYDIFIAEPKVGPRPKDELR
ncbi:hypothetical protein Pcinc_017665 [Petrolisthes cinctipes]|uniref:Uncharacterized protein n=1 Tax=Petrolisthes cinctipes TaxID=88211 RepID=A0AAE1KPN0_PETCI|nr:hypothetical protein Pcinc_017665 [Petrolisthes cinctipes]